MAIKINVPAVLAQAEELASKPVKAGSFLKQKLAEKAAEPAEEQKLPVTEHKGVAKVQVSNEITAMVNELVQLDTHMKSVQAYDTIKRIDEIKKLLSAAAKDMPPEVQAVFEGDDGTIVFSEARVESKITDKPGLIKLMGSDVYMQAASITLGEAKKYLSELELQKVTTTGFGSRTLKAVIAKPGA